MSKNIVICCDGTGNQFSKNNSNVVKLFSVLKKTDKQIAYYSPGVGTLNDSDLWGLKIKQKLYTFTSLAFGRGIKRNVKEAYIYLMNNYQEGDKIFLFGFSRGAYTVRLLAAYIHMIGLLPKGCANLFPYGYQFFKSVNFELAKDFKSTYSRTVLIHFVGVWDTVSSYGTIGNLLKFPFTANNPSIQIVRHALALDERRTYFTQNLFTQKTNIKQVWFAGVHSDVGGSYPEEESGLSKIPLKWMLVEAYDKGLEIEKVKYKQEVLGQKVGFVKPSVTAKMHKSLKNLWWLLEYIPRKKFQYNEEKYKYEINKGHFRDISKSMSTNAAILVHQSVQERANKLAYRPSTLDKVSYKYEPDKELIFRKD